VGGSVGLLLLALVVAVAWRLGDVKRFSELVERARPAWLLVAAALQAATYVCAGAIWWLVLRKERAPQPLGRLVLLSIAKLFTDQAVPSGGVTGTLVLVRAVVRRGTPAGVAAAALVVNLLGFYAAFVVAAIASLVLVWLHREVNAVFVTMTALLFVLALAVPSSLLLFLRGNRSRIVRWLGRFAPLKALLDAFAQAPQQRIRDPVSLAASFGLQLGTIVLDAATLCATLAAVGEPVQAGPAFASFVFAMIAEVVGMAPGGLGTFEATCVALLHVSGVPIEPALAATLLLRGLTFWLPMLPGMWLVQRELV
jgi:uncharacterized protein (TIRG00374 family)